MASLNEFGQPIGAPLPTHWTHPAAAAARRRPGRHVTLERLDVGHAGDLWDALAAAPDSIWTYMSIGPFANESDLAQSVERMAAEPGWQAYAILVGRRAVGFACFLRIDPAAGVLEIGSIAFAPSLQRTSAATEALYLMIDHAFALGYRRCEWKCDDLNAPSRACAVRLGFAYEGTFRSATHYKGRNRDTAWYAIIDTDWPALRSRIRRWLAPENFDGTGTQLNPLSSFQLATDPADMTRLGVDYREL